MRTRTVVTISLVAVVLASAVSCSSKPAPVAPTTPSDGGAPPAPTVAAVDAAAAVDSGPAATGPVFFTGDGGGPTMPTFPTSPTAALDGGAKPNAPVLTEAALDSAIDLAVTTGSPKLAPKMEREGQPGRATLKEGEHFAMVVTLQPNRCYTVIGFSPPGSVAQLDLKLFSLPLNIEAGKSGAGDKAMPVMGKGGAPICPVLPVAVPYKIDAVATKGAGRIGVQVFSRNK